MGTGTPAGGGVMLYLGVDPGKGGALAALNELGQVISIGTIPVVTAAAGKGRAEFDLVAIRDQLERYRDGSGVAAATVEKLQPMPRAMGGAAANFARGVAQGWLWMLVALRIPSLQVAPVTWQRAMHAGTPGSDTKQRSILAAQRLFPGVSLKRSERCKVEHDGIAEALLLAEYGRRVALGRE